MRRECLDFLIPTTESHLPEIMSRWMTHYYRSRRHNRLGLGFPSLRLLEWSSRTVTTCPMAIESSSRRFWAGSLTSTGSRRQREQSRQVFLRMTGFLQGG